MGCVGGICMCVCVFLVNQCLGPPVYGEAFALSTSFKINCVISTFIQSPANPRPSPQLK